MSGVPPSELRWQQVTASESDMAAGASENTSVSAGSNPAEILKAEIGDNNGVSSQFASYRALRLGGVTGGNPRSGQGKIYADVDSGSNSDTDRRTRIRWVKRPKNGDSRTVLTQWYTLRELEVSDVEDRIALPPVFRTVMRNGQQVRVPLLIREGDVLALEATNPANSFTIVRSDTELEFPVQVGH